MFLLLVKSDKILVIGNLQNTGIIGFVVISIIPFLVVFLLL
jgi:hypothetical protein